MQLLVIILLALGTSARADDAAEARVFFDHYVERARAFDPGLGEIFAPDARIATLRDGSDRIEMTGAQWSELISKVMPLAQRRGDIDTFEDIEVAPQGDGFRVTATRISSIKCTRDESYHMDVARVGGTWRVFEEYTETVSLSRCEPSKALAKSLENLQKGLEPQLPIDLDADSRLESVEIAGSAFIYHQRLHAASLSELDLAAAIPALRRVGFQSPAAPPT